MFSVAGRSVITFVIDHEFILFFQIEGPGTVVAPWAVFRSRDVWRGHWWVSIRLARNAQLDEVL
jgi:hypothetical protein